MENTQSDPRFSRAEYYLLNGNMPVSFLLDADGNRYGARKPGVQQGTLVPDATLLSRFDANPEDFSPVGEEVFRQAVRNYETAPAVTASSETIGAYEAYLARQTGSSGRGK